ncbi:hypothetical protein JCM3774_005448 [Rhodotorula dairenensis]
MSSAKAAADRYQRQILALVKEPGNDQCADCRARNPRWASWDQGVFLCVQCASMHRKLGTHISKVKSLTLDTWTREQVETMRQLGNVRVNSLLNPDEQRHPPPAADSGDERNSELERFIRNKYEYRTFAIAPAPSPPPRPPVETRSNGFAAPATSDWSSGRSSTDASPTPPPAYDFTTPALAAPTTARTTSLSAGPSFDRSAPPLPNRPRSTSGSAAVSPTPAAASMTFATTPAFFSASSSPGPDLPPRIGSSVGIRSRSKSVRFPEAPPTVIPSPPDSDADDDDDEPRGERPRSRRSSRPPAKATKGILRFRRDEEILVDWAAFTSPISGNPGDDEDRGEDEDDVPLGSLGALGMRGAQVGMMGVPVQAFPGNGSGDGGGGYAQILPGQAPGQGQWTPQGLHQHLAVPYGASIGQHSTGGGVPVLPPGAAAGGNGGQQVPTVAPLQPQYTGSAKGYLHQQRQHQHQQQQQQQTTAGGGGGLDSFQQMFQPPQPAPAGIETNPFRSHLFARNAYSPSPQPQQQQQLYQQQQQQQQQPSSSSYQPAPRPNQPAPPPAAAHDIWADLDFLSLGGTGSAPTSANRVQDQQQQPHAPVPLRPQLTGFVPSSSFGQQLARETGGGASPAPFASASASASASAPPSTSNGNGLTASRNAPSLTLQIPDHNGGGGSATASPALFGTGSVSNTPLGNANNQHPSPMPAPAPLRPQLTGFVPSSSFGQELARSSFGPAAGGLGQGNPQASSSSSPALLTPAAGTPQPLQPQRTGFVPSSKFGLELAKESTGAASYFPPSPAAAGPTGTDEPAPFDLSPTTPAQQPNHAADAFAHFSSSYTNNVAAQRPPLQQQHQQQQPKANPFLRPQLTGYMPQQQPSFSAGGLQPQLTGFAGTNGHAGHLPPPQQQRPTNPFLAFGAGGGQAWR